MLFVGMTGNDVKLNNKGGATCNQTKQCFTCHEVDLNLPYYSLKKKNMDPVLNATEQNMSR